MSTHSNPIYLNTSFRLIMIGTLDDHFSFKKKNETKIKDDLKSSYHQIIDIVSNFVHVILIVPKLEVWPHAFQKSFTSITLIYFDTRHNR